jgi:UDP-N-acetylmuramate--alanine ligase
MPIEGVDAELILKNVKLSNKCYSKKEDLLELLRARDLDVLVTFGAGDIDKMVPLIHEELKNQHQQLKLEETQLLETIE